MLDNQFIMVVGVVENSNDPKLGTLTCSIPGIYTSENGNTSNLPEVRPLTDFGKPPKRGDKVWVLIKVDNDIDYNEQSQVVTHNQVKLMTDTSFYIPTKEPTDTELQFLIDNAKNNPQILFCQENGDQVNAQVYDDVNGMVTSVGETNMQLSPTGGWALQTTDTAIKASGSCIELGASKSSEDDQNVSTYSMPLGDKVVEMFGKISTVIGELASEFHKMDRDEIGKLLYDYSADIDSFKEELTTQQVKINVNKLSKLSNA